MPEGAQIPEPPQKGAPDMLCRPTALQAIVQTWLVADEAAITIFHSFTVIEIGSDIHAGIVAQGSSSPWGDLNDGVHIVAHRILPQQIGEEVIITGRKTESDQSLVWAFNHQAIILARLRIGLLNTRQENLVVGILASLGSQNPA